MRVNKIYSIIDSDEELIIINKSPGVLSVPGRFTDAPNALEHLRKKYGEVLAIHRIDKYTTGIVAYARNPEMQKYLSGLFEGRKVTKRYLAFTAGIPPSSSGIIDFPLKTTGSGKVIAAADGKPSKTEYTVVESFKGYALVEAVPATGRTHQIRVHFAESGFPLAFDPQYGPAEPITIADIKRRASIPKYAESLPALIDRTPLHASVLSFQMPDGEMREYVCSLPKDMNAFLNQLRKWRSFSE